MKWTNKGHEYDHMFEEIKRKSKYFLFGAGDYGTQFYNLFKSKIDIVGYIDNNRNKQGKEINGLKCFALNDALIENTTGIIVTMSQIARINPVEQLEKMGLKRNINYFIIEEFISVFHVYYENKIYFSSISFLPSTVCNLNCRHCLNFNPFAKKFYQRDWDSIKSDIDIFFSKVDRIMLFHVSGGEPMLYRYTADLIEYLNQNYKDRIDTLRTVTNGTVQISDRMLSVLKECDVEVTVDDYRDAVPHLSNVFEENIAKFKENGINFYINKANQWIDLAPERSDFSDKSTEWLIRHRDECSQSWQELRDGKLYSCNYAAYATVAGIAGEQDLEETYNLYEHTGDRNKELIEFRLGYSEKGFTHFCTKCMGFTPDNQLNVEPAVQCKRGSLE